MGGEEAEAGEEAKAGEGIVVSSNTGMTGTGTGIGIGIGTGTGTGTRTGTGGMEVDISQVLQAPTRDTTPIIRDHIMTDTDLYSNLSGVVCIYSIQSYKFNFSIIYCSVLFILFFITTVS